MILTEASSPVAGCMKMREWLLAGAWAPEMKASRIQENNKATKAVVFIFRAILSCRIPHKDPE